MSWKHERPSAAARGYGARWQKLRARILARDCYVCRCAECASSGRVRPATEVDHKVSKAAWLKTHGTLAGVDDPSNLQAINTECHKRKTMQEMGRKPRVAIGLDGLPVER